MSAGDTGAIGPVSVRYAAQIRELLHAQALQRMAAAEEAARASAEAERAARTEPVAKPEAPAPVERQPAKVSSEQAATPAAPERARVDKAEPTQTGQLIDIQA